MDISRILRLGVLLLLLLAGAPPSAAARAHFDSQSPDKSVRLRRIAGQHGANYRLVHAKSGRFLSPAIFLLDEQNTNALESSWSSDGRYVVFLLFYGTKLSSVSIYARSAAGFYREVSGPDEGSALPYVNPDDASQYLPAELGTWTSLGTLRLRYYRMINEQDYPCHVTAECELRVRGRRATLRLLRVFANPPRKVEAENSSTDPEPIPPDPILDDWRRRNDTLPAWKAWLESPFE